MTTPNKTYAAQRHEEKLCAPAKKRSQRLIKSLRKHMEWLEKLLIFHGSLKEPGNAERVQRERNGRVLWVTWFACCSITLPFDSIFTFGWSAAFLRDRLGRVLPLSPAFLDAAIAIALAITILALTVALRIATDSCKDRERLNGISAEDPEVFELEQSIRRKSWIRGSWAAVLAVLLAGAALAEMLTITAYQQFDPAGDTWVTNASRHIQLLALATPYTVTYVLHMLLLFLPLPSSGLFLPYPCAPGKTQTNIDATNRAIRSTSLDLYTEIVGLPVEIARRIVDLLTESEKTMINETLGRKVLPMFEQNQIEQGSAPEGNNTLPADFKASAPSSV